MRSVNVLVAGGGASGLMAAITAASYGNSTVILEKNDIPGKKINATGNGKCNFTNLDMDKKYYNKSARDFVNEEFSTFSCDDTLSFFRDRLGMLIYERNGYVYPRSEQAVSVREALVREAERTGVRIICGAAVKSISRKTVGKRNVFMVDSKAGKFSAQKVILSCGTASGPVSGADGSGFEIASSLGHRIVHPVPALTCVTLDEDTGIMKHWKGVRFRGSIDMNVSEGHIYDSGEIILNERGISGIPVFQLSGRAARDIDDALPVKGSFSIMPDVEIKDIVRILKRNRTVYGNCPASGMFLGNVNSRLAEAVLMKCGTDPFKSAADISDSEIEKAAAICRKWNIRVTGTGDFKNSQVTSGGVALDEIDPETGQSRILQGLFFAGEVMDVDGQCGGYNLQWAWTSGYTAGRGTCIS